MLFLGDSRVSRLEDAWKKGKYCLHGWEARFIGRSGGRLEEFPQSLGLYKNIDPSLKPDIIVVCAFLVDALKMESGEVLNQGKYLRLRREVHDGEVFPALDGLKEKVRRIWVEIKETFEKAKIIWTIPHPVDCLRWRHMKGLKGVHPSTCMTWREHVQCQGESFKILKYFRRVDELVLEEFGSGWWSVPWIIFWRKQCSREELTLKEWESMCKEGKVVGFFNESGSEDGLHPSPGSCRGVLDSIMSRMREESCQPVRDGNPSSRPPVRRGSEKLESTGGPRDEVADVNRRRMISLSGLERDSASVGTQTDPQEKKDVGCQVEVLLGTGGDFERSPRMGDSMAIQLWCRHVRLVPRSYWGRLAEIKCLECPDE